VPIVGKKNPRCNDPDTSELCHFFHAANVKVEALDDVTFRQQINIATTMGVGYSCALPIITMPPSVKGSCQLGMWVGGVYKEQDPNSDGSGWLGFAVEGLATLLGPEAAAAAEVATSLGEFTVSDVCLSLRTTYAHQIITETWDYHQVCRGRATHFSHGRR